jgi:murein DD-endopeptidase MepM/ murein hydrolase activator NlpD
MPKLPVDDTTADVAEFAGILHIPDIMSFMRPGNDVTNGDVEIIAMAPPPPPAAPEQDEAGLVPFNPDNNLPVVTDASRQYKLLRSMAREVRGIRESLSEIGLPQANLPELESLDQFVETADFASLAMAVEDHRSLLRKVPLKPPMLYFYISSNYGMRRHPVLKTNRFHHGIDLAGTWQETVHAPAPGTVIYAGRKGSFGKVVQVRHAYGLVTTYAHLAKITVRKGADVVPGTVVGKMGRTGRVDGAHLHYEIRLGDKSIDPKKFFALGHRIGVGGELMLAADGQ